MRQLKRSSTGLLFAVALAGCNTTDALTPPENIGTDGQQAAASQPLTQGDVNAMAQSPSATDQQVNLQQTAMTADTETAAAGQPTGPRPPMLGAAGGISATQKSIYQSGVQQAAGSVRFLPIIGAPLQSVTPLSQELANAARAHSLAIKPSSDASADHMLKGYFSAFPDGSGTTVTYVWDILDGSGSRLNRIQGQEKAAGNANDPWANVTPDLMKKIADDTITRYLSWKASSQG